MTMTSGKERERRGLGLRVVVGVSLGHRSMTERGWGIIKSTNPRDVNYECPFVVQS